MKRTVSKIYLLSLVVLTLYGCGQSPRGGPEEAIDTLFFCEPVDTTIPTFVKDIQYIPLNRK